MSDTTADLQPPAIPTEEPPQQIEVAITDVPVANQSVALKLLVAFAQLAYKRSAYNMDETAKLVECIKMFQPAPTDNAAAPASEEI